MAGKPGMPHRLFHRVEEARDILVKHASSLMKAAIKGAKQAAKEGDPGPAMELLKHLATQDEAGKEVRPIAPSVDKPALQAGGEAGGPRILIGIAVAGTKLSSGEMVTQARLVGGQSPTIIEAQTPTVIDVTPEPQPVVVDGVVEDAE